MIDWGLPTVNGIEKDGRTFLRVTFTGEEPMDLTEAEFAKLLEKINKVVRNEWQRFRDFKKHQDRPVREDDKGVMILTFGERFNSGHRYGTVETLMHLHSLICGDEDHHTWMHHPRNASDPFTTMITGNFILLQTLKGVIENRSWLNFDERWHAMVDNLRMPIEPCRVILGERFTALCNNIRSIELIRN